MIRMTPCRVRLLLWSLALGGLAGLSGCGGNEDISRYQAPHEEPPEKVRLLGAFFPKGENTWVFKLVATDTLFKQYQDAYLKLLESVRLSEQPGKPITWTLPEGWRQEIDNKPLRYATLSAGKGEEAVEATVSKMDRRQDLLQNVNRWRGQLGLGPVGEEEVPRFTTHSKIGGIDTTLVSLTTFRTRRAAPRAPEPEGPPFKYEAPAGWEKAQRLPPFAVLAFQTGEGKETAAVTVSPLTGRAGGLLANVNRWRTQVGLKDDQTEEGLQKEQKTITVNGMDAPYFDLSGPPEKGGKRLLAVVLKRDNASWFFKLLGPAEVVAKQRAAFEAFVKSVRFDAGKGAEQ
jgi:hypothetical protein